ncbi:ribonuclease R [Candidatus Kapabacteria bacterium]|nr:ribonuclease R [Candidatus Kapabacteria bacterium]
MFDQKKKESVTSQILEFMRFKKVPVKLHQLSKHLNIDSHSPEYKTLDELLDELATNLVIEKLTRRRYALAGSSNTNVIGILYVEPLKSYVIDEDKNAKVHIRNRFLSNALHGDKVEVELLVDPKRKLFGKVIDVLERNVTKLKGKVDFDGNEYFFIPESEHYLFDFHIPSDKLKGAKDRDFVTAHILEWNNSTSNPSVEIDEVLMNLESNAYKYDAIVAEFELNPHFPKEVVKESEEYDIPKAKSKYPGRMDLRDELVITIDPDDAKDFDDALSLMFLENGNIELGVHIADVSHYVKENSELDIEARNRGNSTYLADRVVPMLPERLSNNICSLKPNTIRFAHTVFIEYDKECNVVDYEIAETVIKSDKRFTYDDVFKIITDQDGLHKDLILAIDKLALDLRKKRFLKGGINFETSEVKFSFNDKKEPIEAKLKKSNRATQLVEECMLAANQVVAKHFTNLTKDFMLSAPVPTIYRVHENPDTEKIDQAVEFVASLGSVPKKKNLTSKDINKIIENFHGKPEADLVNSVLIRSLPKAFYDPGSKGHYGLGFQDYTHFTSPIRRYADLIVHRAIKEYAKGKPEIPRLRTLQVFMQGVSKHISETERFSMDAERASTKLTQTIILSSRIGEEFLGTVTGVTNFGVFVMVDDVFAEGLVRIKNIGADYYYFDEKRYRFVGKRTKKQIKIGTKMHIRVAKVNTEKRIIDFDFVSLIKESKLDG